MIFSSNSFKLRMFVLNWFEKQRSNDLIKTCFTLEPFRMHSIAKNSALPIQSFRFKGQRACVDSTRERRSCENTYFVFDVPLSGDWPIFCNYFSGRLWSVNFLLIKIRNWAIRLSINKTFKPCSFCSMNREIFSSVPANGMPVAWRLRFRRNHQEDTQDNQ